MNKGRIAFGGSSVRSLYLLLFVLFIGACIVVAGLRFGRANAQEETDLSPSLVVFSESFDSVIAPALPAGWTTSVTGQIDLFKTVTLLPDSPPNSAFVNDPNTAGVSELVSPSIALGNVQHKLSFRHFYQTDFLFDGCVVELSINGGAFQDLISAGGTFVTGAYNAQLVSSALSGRMSWTGQEANYITTEVMLPLSTNNQSVRFRWRIATDDMEAGTGWRIDNVQVSNAISGSNLSSIVIPASGAATPYPSEITVSNLPGFVTGVQVRLSNFSHTSPDDVDLMLVAPNGRIVILMSDAGGSNPVSNLNLFFTDAAPGTLPDNTVISSGNYRPTNFEPNDTFPLPAPAGSPTGARLSALNGSSPNGTWQLFFVDDNGNNAGSVSGGWDLFIQSSTDAIAIPEAGAAQPYASEKTVLGIQGTVTKVTVTLSNFSHTSPDDVDVMLVAPNGRHIILMSDVGGTTETGGLNFTFDDDAVSSLPDSAPLTAGTFKPTDFEPADVFPVPAPQTPQTGTTLSAFYASAPTGIWKLFVVDDTGANAGSIAGSWSLNLQTSTTACAFTLSPSVQTFPITGSDGSFTINMPSLCSWSASTIANFITINSVANGAGNGSISFTVAPNFNGGRSGTIDVSNGVVTRTFQVQQPSGCPFTLNPSQVNIGANGGPGQVAVTAGGVCGWQGSSGVSWVTITSAPQNGDGNVTFTVQPNTSGSSRNTTITVGARTFSVNQAGASGKSFDYDGDGRADVSVFRPSNGFWYLLQSTAGFRGEQFGLSDDRIVPADYDGDAKTDLAVFRASTGFWYYVDSSSSAFHSVQFGQNGDFATGGDYDGDGKADISIYRPSDNKFYLINSSDGSFHFQQWGAAGDVPLVGDYDGDGRTDFAIFRPSTSSFYVLSSSNGTVIGQQWGIAGDKPIAADFDGDGRSDIAVFRPSTGAWYYLRSIDGGFVGIGWGTNGDIPAPSDYDGDSKWDVAVFRPSNGVFYILQSVGNSLRAAQFGTNGDIPTQAARIP